MDAFPAIARAQPEPQDETIAIDEESLRSVYPLLKGIARGLMRSERKSHTLQPTALVNEAWLKLAAGHQQKFANKEHFVCVAARAMRQILVDHARSRRSLRRSVVQAEGEPSLPAVAAASPEDLLALDAAMAKLDAIDTRLTRIVELRCFADLSIEETAQVLSLSTATVKREWRIAKSMLAGHLQRGV
jgi:RNA polymerase sigma factor (TIGR02999 family)